MFVGCWWWRPSEPAQKSLVVVVVVAVGSKVFAPRIVAF